MINVSDNELVEKILADVKACCSFGVVGKNLYQQKRNRS